MYQKKHIKKSVFPNQLYNQMQLSNSNIKFGDPSSLNSYIVDNQFFLQSNNLSFFALVKIVLDRSKNNVLVLIFDLIYNLDLSVTIQIGPK